MKKYAVAMFFEKTVSVSHSLNQLQQRMELLFIEANSNQEALGKALEQSEFRNKQFPLIFNIVKEIK